MKRISAVICELNPLHDGHRYVFEKAKEQGDVLVAVMSGNFVQRGESAVYNKYKRAAAALSAGADLVVELPFPFSASSAEYFARAGVKIAEAMGADVLCFGSECGDIEALKTAGAVLDCDEYKNGMTVGRSAEMRGELLRALAPDLPESLLNSPNDILGAEYCRRAKIETVAVKRISAESASSIRARCVGAEGGDMLDPTRLFELEYNFFRTRRDFSGEYAECTGGVFERLYNTAFSSADAAEWFERVKTKQYTNARLRRAALYALMQVTGEELQSDVLFTRLLAANEKGREHLASIRKVTDFPIITNHSEKKFLSENARIQADLADFADSIYALCEKREDPAFYLKSHPVITR